jgi:TPR repeat protein
MAIWENLAMKKILSALLMSAVLGIALANPAWEASDANDRGDYATALKITRPLAESGVAWAQSSLGYSFASGRGVVQDYAEAAKWFRLRRQRKGTRSCR